MVGMIVIPMRYSQCIEGKYLFSIIQPLILLFLLSLLHHHVSLPLTLKIKVIDYLSSNLNLGKGKQYKSVTFNHNEGMASTWTTPLGKCYKKMAFDQLGRTPPPHPLPLSWHSEFWNCWPIFFILMDTKHFKMDFSTKKKKTIIHFLHSPTIHSLKTILYLLSFEAFNDGIYSTNMVYFDCSPIIQQPSCYIHCL